MSKCADDNKQPTWMQSTQCLRHAMVGTCCAPPLGLNYYVPYLGEDSHLLCCTLPQLLEQLLQRPHTGLQANRHQCPVSRAQLGLVARLSISHPTTRSEAGRRLETQGLALLTSMPCMSLMNMCLTLSAGTQASWCEQRLGWLEQHCSCGLATAATRTLNPEAHKLLELSYSLREGLSHL